MCHDEIKHTKNNVAIAANNISVSVFIYFTHKHSKTIRLLLFAVISQCLDVACSYIYILNSLINMVWLIMSFIGQTDTHIHTQAIKSGKIHSFFFIVAVAPCACCNGSDGSASAAAMTLTFQSNDLSRLISASSLTNTCTKLNLHNSYLQQQSLLN